MDNFEKKILEIARNIMDSSRSTLVVKLRFMDSAISRLKPEVYAEMPPQATNGMSIYYDPKSIIKMFKEEHNLPTHAYLHSVFHCVFQHFYVDISIIDHDLWNLACDMAVEAMILDINVDKLILNSDVKRQAILKGIKDKCKHLTAEFIYRYLKDGNETYNTIEEWSELFAMDNHEVWYMYGDEADEDDDERGRSVTKNKNDDNSDNQGNDDNQGDDQGNSDDQGNGDDDDQGDDQDDGDDQGNGDGEDQGDDQGDGQGNGDGDDQDDGDGDNQGSGNSQSDGQDDANSQGSNSSRKKSKMPDLNKLKKLQDDWKNVAESIQTDMQTFSKTHGDAMGNMMQNLKEVTREKHDYTEFLKKFAVNGEVTKINEDEFDYGFYHYGRSLIDKSMIEPLEYKDEKRIKEFVIAIDTSGSVQGEIVQRFINKTYNILKQEESYFKKINVHIIQCDTVIQEDVKITCQEEFDAYIKNMKLKGFGGTDFRPVFEHVEDLIKDKEFTNLKGLIYFTDGYGTFPLKQPTYKTAFVFLDDGYDPPQIPVWAIRLMLREDEF